jgi:hypothetical protein
MTEPLAIGQSYDDLIRFVRERASALGMTDKILEEIGGFTPGHIGKLLGAARTKNLGPLTFGMILGALGLKFAIIEDEEATARIRKRFDPSEKSKRVLAVASIAISPELATAVFSDHLNRIAPSGGLARAEQLTPFRRSQIARKAAKARWKRPRNKPSMGTF